MKNLRYQKKVIHSRKLLLTLLSYFFIVLLLPTIVGSIAYWKSVQLIGDEIQDTKTKMLSQVSHAIDTQLSEIQRLALQTATNYYILDLLSCKNPSDEDTVYKAVHAIREIATLKNANSFIEDIFVYSKNMDCIANANSLYKTDFFFDYSYTYKDIDYTEWISELSEQVNYNTYWPSQNVQVYRKTSHPIITYIQSIPIAERYSPYGCVVILINEDKILSLFEDIAKDGTALVVNSQNEVVTQTENRYSYYPQIEEMPLSQDMIKKNVNFEEIVSLYNTSSITDWKYLSIYSENTFMQKANYIRTFTIILVGLGLLLGMIAAYFLSKKVYSPIGSLFAMLLQNSKVHYESDDKENEMEFIHHAVSQTLKENRSLTLEIQKHSSLYEQNLPYLKNVLLLKLLNHLGKQQEEWYT